MTKRAKLTLKARITLSVSIIVVLAIAAVAYSTLSIYQRELKAEISSNQETLLSVIADDLDSKLLNAQQLLIANAAVMPREALRDVEAAQRFLDSRVGLLRIFDNNIGLFTAAGTEVTESPFTVDRRGKDYSFRPYIKNTVASGKPYISAPYISSQPHGHPAIMMTAPIFDSSGALTGILAGSMDLLEENLLGRVGRIQVGRTGYLYLTTADRIVIIHPIKERIFKRIEPGMNPLYDQVINEGFEGTDHTTNAQGLMLLTTYKRLKVNNWVLASNYPIEEAYAPIRRLERSFLIASIVSVAVMVFLLVLLVRHFTRPLAEFTRHVEELPRKEGAARLLHVTTDDELGTLAQAFNTMLGELDDQQSALREHQELFSLVMEHTPVYTFIKSVGNGVSRVLQISSNYEQMLGMPAKDMLGKTMQELFPGPLAGSMTADDLRVVEQGTVLQVDEELKGRNYTTIKFPILREGRSSLLAGFTLDITERKHTEKQLLESEERFRELAEALPQTVFEMDLQGRFTFVNRGALVMFGYTREDVAGGISVMQMIAPGDRERAAENIASLYRGERRENEEYVALRKDGTTFPAMVHTAVILRDRKPSGMRGLLVDISDRKQAEAELLKVQKLESIGVLAGGIAHDFNNILTAILGNLSLARMQLRAGDPLQERLGEAEKAIFHARDLTSQLLTFARGGTPVKKAVSLESVVRNAAAVAGRGTNVKVDIGSSGDLPPVEADEGQLGQVFSNLIINACQAMPNGGTVRISAEACTADSVLPLPAAGEYVCVKVEDQGVGIPPEHLPRIFDPYFTTKQKGSGLGLAIAYSVVKGHGGHISAASVPGKGTIFTVYLPATEKPVKAAAARRQVVRGKGRVLVMDDEELVRAVLAAILKELGYEVVEAGSGEKAVTLYQEAMEAGRAFAAVIMDLTVPGGMGGKDAVQRLLAMDPEAKAIVSSGYSHDPVMADPRSFGFRGVVTKPYQVAELSAVLHEVISGAATPPPNTDTG